MPPYLNTRQACHGYDVDMKPTTIFLPDQLHERLREEAFRTGVSMAELIRSKLQDRPTAPGKSKSKADPLLAVAGIGNDGRLTARIDEELYVL